MAKKTIEFPECWEELSPDEWEYLLRLRGLLIERKGQITLEDVNRRWCSFCLKKRGISRYRRYTDYLVLVNQLSKTLDWMWRTDNGIIELTFDSTVNLLPVWRSFRYSFYGPADHGADLTFGEFRYAVNMMNEFTATHDVAYLDNLCAVLYRELDYLGNRVRFSQHLMAENSAVLSHMPLYLKWGVYAWLASFCKFLFTGTFVIDGNEVCFGPVFESKGRNSYTPEQSIGFNSILFSVAESGVFGSVEDVDNTQLMRVLLKLLDDKQKADSLQKMIKK